MKILNLLESLENLEKGVDSVLREAKADAAREYLKNTDSPSYSDYVKELESKNMEDQKISRVFFNKLRKALAAKSQNTPSSKPSLKADPPKPSQGETASKRKAELAKLVTRAKAAVESAPEREEATNPQGALAKAEQALKEAGLGYYDSDIDLREWNGKQFVDIRIITGDRGPRIDHGGGDDGDDWMDDYQVEDAAAPYRKKWQPKIDRAKEKFESLGIFQKVEGYVDYGEKGHVDLDFSLQLR